MLIWGIVDFIESELCFSWRTGVLICLFIAFVLLPPIILRLCRSILGNETVSYQTAKILENGGEGFIGTYILPFLSNVITDQWYILMIGVMVVLTIVIWISNSFCFNPVLSFFGYRFFEVSNSKGVTFILLSSKTILDPNDVKQIYHVTDYLKLDGRNKRDV